MTGKKINIDEFIKEKLGKHEHSYKPEYWSAMEKILTGATVGTIATGVVKILGLAKWKFLAIITSVSIISSVAVYFTIISQNKHHKPIAQKEISVQKKDVNIPEKSQEIKLSDINHAESIASHKIPNNKIPIIKKIEIPVSDNLKKDNKNEGQIVYDIKSEDNIISKTENILNDQKDNIVVFSTDTSITKTEAEIKEKSEQKDSLITEKVNDSLTEAKQDIQIITEYNKLSLNAGVFMMNTFTNIASPEPKYMISPSVGLSYYYPINESTSFILSGNYIQCKHNSLDRYAVYTKYFFYKEIDSVYLSLKNIDFLNFSFDLRRKFNNHYLTGGLFTATRLNTLSTKTRVILNPYYFNSQTTEEKGYFEGISTVSFGLSLGYEYHLFRNAYTGIRLNQTFNDLIDNKIYTFNKKDFITQFGVYFKWMIF